MQAYCMKCKKKVEIDNPKVIAMKTGRPAAQGKCSICGTKVFRIVAQREMHLSDKPILSASPSPPPPPPPPKEIRLFLVDDHQVVRQGLRAMLESEEDIKIIGDCSSGEEAIPQVERLSPDIVLLDVRMPGINGIEACRQLKAKGLACDVIILTLYGEHFAEAIEAGAKGYLPKDIRREELIETIRQVYNSRTSQEQGDDSNRLDEVELVILPPSGTAHLLRFAGQLPETLGGSIAQSVGFRDGSTAITFVLAIPVPLENILDNLKKLPDVEKVDAKMAIRDSVTGFLKKPFGGMLRSRTGHKKRILISLKQASMAGQRDLVGIC